MAYDDLTQTDKDKVDYFSTNLRAMSGEFSQQLQKVQALKDYWDANDISTPLGTLADADMIPNKTGLSGAVDIQKAELMALVGNLASLLSTYDTQALRLARVKAAGINASL